jgi:hypothetical protein
LARAAGIRLSRAAAISGATSTGRTLSRNRAAMMRDMSRMSDTSCACSIAFRSIVSSPRVIVAASSWPDRSR